MHEGERIPAVKLGQNWGNFTTEPITKVVLATNLLENDSEHLENLEARGANPFKAADELIARLRGTPQAESQDAVEEPTTDMPAAADSRANNGRMLSDADLKAIGFKGTYEEYEAQLDGTLNTLKVGKEQAVTEAQPANNDGNIAEMDAQKKKQRRSFSLRDRWNKLGPGSKRNVAVGLGILSLMSFLAVVEGGNDGDNDRAPAPKTTTEQTNPTTPKLRSGTDGDMAPKTTTNTNTLGGAEAPQSTSTTRTGTTIEQQNADRLNSGSN
jgi:hypothetical protein